MSNLANLQLYIGDEWTFSIVPADGTSGIGATMLVGGSGYTSLPQIVFSAPPLGGRAAIATAVVTSGALSGILFSDQGVYTPGYPPSITLIGGGGLGASASAVVGIPLDMAGCTVGTEFFTSKFAAAVDISSTVSVASQAFVSASGVPFTANAMISITVPRTLTAQTVACLPTIEMAATRVHVYYTDAAGNRRTICVIPIIPTAP